MMYEFEKKKKKKKHHYTILKHCGILIGIGVVVSNDEL